MKREASVPNLIQVGRLAAGRPQLEGRVAGRPEGKALSYFAARKTVEHTSKANLTRARTRHCRIRPQAAPSQGRGTLSTCCGMFSISPPPHHPPHQTPLLKRRPIGQSIGASAPRGKGYTVVGAAGWRAAPPCKALSREGTAVGTQQKGGALRTRTNGASINASDRVPTTAAAPPDRRRDGQYCSPPPHPHSHLSNRGFSPGYPGTDGQPTADCKPHLP